MTETADNRLAELEDVEDLEGYEEDRLMKAVRKLAEIRSRYPLKLTKEECLAMEESDRSLWMTYMRDSYDPPYAGVKETKFEIVEEPGKELWTPEAKRAVLAGGLCPVCSGKRAEEAVCRGLVTNFYFLKDFECFCVEVLDFQRMVKERLPESLRGFALNSLGWSPKSRLDPERQEREIAFLREHPDDSYFFLGKPGTSKTTYAAALFLRALGRNFRHFRHTCNPTECMWRVDGNHLFESEVAYVTANDKESVKRDITVEEIFRAKKHGHRPVLLLEEIDKRKMTEFAANILFRLVNAMDECNGQLILTTNLTMQGFRNMFLKSDIEQVRVSGEALLRRLTDPETSHEAAIGAKIWAQVHFRKIVECLSANGPIAQKEIASATGLAEISCSPLLRPMRRAAVLNGRRKGTGYPPA